MRPALLPIGAMLLASCFSGAVVDLPRAPDGTKLGLFVTADAYRSFVDASELGQRAYAADEPAYALYYGCDLATLALESAGPLVPPDMESDPLPTTDARYRLSFEDRSFVPLESPSSLDGALIHDLRSAADCVESSQPRAFPDLAERTLESVAIADPETGLLVAAKPEGSLLVAEDGSQTSIDLAFSAEAVARNPSTGRIFLFNRTKTGTPTLNVAEVDGPLRAATGTTVEWTVIDRFAIPALIDPEDPGFQLSLVSGTSALVICQRSPRLIECRRRDGESVYSSRGHDWLFSAVDGIYIHRDGSAVIQVTATGSVIQDLEPIRKFSVDALDEAVAVSVDGQVYRKHAGMDWQPDPSLPSLDEDFNDVWFGEFGAVTRTIAMTWYQPLGTVHCRGSNLIPEEILTARHALISVYLSRNFVTWVHPLIPAPPPSCGLSR